MGDLMRTLPLTLLSCCCIGSFLNCPTTAQDAQTLRVDRQEAVLLHVVDGWAIWRTSPPVEIKRRSRLSRADFRIYRQRIPDPVAHLVLHTVQGAGFNPCQAIADDGTLITLSRMGNSVVWYRPDGTVEESVKVGERDKLLRAYLDGVILQANRTHFIDGFTPRVETSHFFVPLRGKELDFDNQVKIRSDADSPFQGTEPLRSGNILLWNTPQGLRRIDLKTGERSCVAIEDDGTQFNLRSAYVEAFDGQLALLGSNVVVDAQTGKRVATNWDDKRINYLTMTNEGIGYRVVDGKLEAIDLGQPEKPPVVLSEEAHQPIARTASGVLMWTGDAWKTIPWYERRSPRDSGRTKR